MGWSGTKNFLWGDEPQDTVDDAINQYYGSVSYDTYWDYPDNIKKAAFDILKGKELLRTKVDNAFRREFGRDANNKEFENLLIVGLGMKDGRTVYRGPERKAKKKGKAKKAMKRGHTKTGVRGMR